jgi:hypothetical protein
MMRESAPEGAPVTAANDQLERTERSHDVNDEQSHRTPSVTPSCPCGRSIRWMRTDAKFCSSACRQRAYRERKAVAA